MEKPDVLFVVGIAASAGGMEAMVELLEHASCHKSICFVIVSHLSRFSESELAMILSRASNLEAVEITDGIAVKHCGVYTIPPNRYVRIEDGKLWLSRRPEDAPNNCADFFFESLAQAYGPNAIGVVLSGAKVGADGAAGTVAIKKANGHTYAQDPATAKFADMPELAIATGCVDQVLSPTAIGQELSLIGWTT